MFLSPPNFVLTSLERLSRAGFEAYLVGGCVRDALLGREPGDYDIATDAMPEQVRGVFSGHQTVDIGMRHGTLTVIVNGCPLEVTTYRRDGIYSDGRHPDQVSFTRSLEEDLIRRDFTVNAMAWHPDSGLIDPANGRLDCEKRLIRAVGEPAKRFSEDALRILRALRFACQLGFEIEQNTLHAMMKEAAGLSRVSAERVANELNRALLGDFAAQALRAYPRVLFLALPELEPLLPASARSSGIWEHTLSTLIGVPPDPALRWAALFLHSGNPHAISRDPDGAARFTGHQAASARLAGGALQRLRQSKLLSEQAVTLIRHHNQNISPKNLRLWLSFLGPETAKKLLLLKRSDLCAREPDSAPIIHQLDALYGEAVRLENEGLCLNVRDLAVNGDDLLAMGFREDKRLGLALGKLLRRVLLDELDNQRGALLEAAKDMLIPE